MLLLHVRVNQPSSQRVSKKRRRVKSRTGSGYTGRAKVKRPVGKEDSGPVEFSIGKVQSSEEEILQRRRVEEVY